MAKEKTVTIPRGTVLAYRVLQLVIKEDCWGKWRLEAQEQQRQDSPSEGWQRGRGYLQMWSRKREREAISQRPEPSARQLHLLAAAKRI